MYGIREFLMYSVLGVAGLIALLFGYVRLQERMIFLPSTYAESRLEQIPKPFEFVRFPAADEVELTGVWAYRGPDRPTLILAHGNAGHMLDRMFWLRDVVPDHWNGLLFDYRGYGRSGGRPDEPGLYRDIEGALAFVREQTRDPDVVLHGRSLGVPVVARGAAHPRLGGLVRGLILDSGFTSGIEVARTILPLPGLRYLVSVKFRTVQALKQAGARHGAIPKLVIHGTNDRVIPFRLGKQLYEQTPPPRESFFVEGAGHNNLIQMAGSKYRERIDRFLNKAVDSGSG